MTWLAYSHLGVARTVQLTTQPAGSLAGIPFSVQPVGRLVDGSGVLSRATGVTVTASKASGTGTLSGTLSVQTVEGVFTFTDLKMDTVTAAVTLQFASSGLTSAVSNAFNVTQPNTIIGIESGTYAVTGTAQTLTRGPYMMRQDASGSYTVTGTAVTLTYSGGAATLLAAFSATDDGFTTKNGITLYDRANFDVWTGWSYDGTKSYRSKQGDSGGWTELGFQGLAQVDEIYVSFRAYMPDGTEGIGPAVSVPTSGTNDKLLRVWGYSYGGTYNQKMGGSTWNGQAGGEYQWSGGPGNRWDMGQGPYANPKGDLWVAANRGRWLRVRFRCKQATAANNDGIEQVWVDDTLIVNLTTIENYVFPEDRAPNPNGGHNYLEEGYILGYWNSGAPAGQYMYLDDVRFSTGGFA